MNSEKFCRPSRTINFPFCELQDPPDVQRVKFIQLENSVLIPGLVAAQNLTGSPAAKQIWETPRELMVPESVMYDAEHQVIYVANIAGKPTEKNGQGFIAQINLDGRIKKLRWVTGLNAPKGMGIFQDTLYVTDIDRVHAIDMGSGKIKGTWNGPTYWN